MIGLGAAYGVAIPLFVLTLPLLPLKVATHFNVGGQPDDWSTRHQWAVSTVFMAIFLPALVLGLTMLVRWLPLGMINLPNRSYWLAPENLPAMHQKLMAFGVWMAALVVYLFVALHILILEAHRFNPPRLSQGGLAIAAAIFLAAVAVLVVRLLVDLQRVPKIDVVH